jgi:coenzyme F420 biosynthesis associated uncharacterized protein
VARRPKAPVPDAEPDASSTAPDPTASDAAADSSGPPKQLVDWGVAVTTAQRIVRPGPQISKDEARAVGRELRRLVPIAERHVAEYTGLLPPDEHIPVAVVDRLGWVKANVDGFQVALEPLMSKLIARRGEPSALVRSVGSKVSGAQVGLLMAFLASRVLGQFELFLPPGESAMGRLTLVAPNIVETERRLDVDPHDFRLWVTLHECTHRTQFTAVPWLRGYFIEQLHSFLDLAELDPMQVLARLRSAAGAIGDAVRRREAAPSLIEVLQTPEQRVILARLQALMSLLEGHGDFVMDGVGPAVVPSAEEIRRRFDERRTGGSAVDRVMRKLLGLDLKMRQYAEGAAFVRAVVEDVGMASFNQVWTSPGTLPTAAEIADPAQWVRRVVRAIPA